MNTRAEAWRRILAAVIDLLILWIGGSMIGLLLGIILLQYIHDQWRVEVWAGIAVAIFWLLYGSLEIIAAASPGKMMLGIRIAQLDGSKAPRSLLVLRWSTKYLPQMLLLIYLLSNNGFIQLMAGLINAVIWIGCLQFLDEEKRSWLDQWAHTSVVKKRGASGAEVLASDVQLQGR